MACAADSTRANPRPARAYHRGDAVKARVLVPGDPDTGVPSSSFVATPCRAGSSWRACECGGRPPHPSTPPRPHPALPSACLTVETRCGDHTSGNVSNCPVPDLTYLDEYYSLDTDCSDGLSMDEFRHTTTLFDQPSYLVLVHYPLPRRVNDFAKAIIDRKWAEVFAAADADRDEQLSFLEWLRLFRDYKPTFRHCGQALRDRFYRLANTLGRRPSGAFPIKPCATCPEHWWAAAILARIPSVWWREGCDWDPPYLARSCNENEAQTIVTGSSASRTCMAVVGTSCTVRRWWMWWPASRLPARHVGHMALI
eukprot:COSAG01_NODE_4862_length_4677_cov_3.891219_5_plen_311_part_00